MKDKIFITINGYKALKAELEHLLKVERPEVTETVAWAASNGDRSENADYHYGKKRLREIDKRIGFLSKRIDSAEIIDPLKIQSEKIQIGATVSLLTEEGDQKTYSIVGVDEVDLDQGKISWRSPLGAALVNSKSGDFVTYHSPKGELSVEIISLEYIEIP